MGVRYIVVAGIENKELLKEKMYKMCKFVPWQELVV